MLMVTAAIRIPLDEFRFTYARSSGPGGQNVNKVNSKAILHWPVHSSPALPVDVRDRFVVRFANRLTRAGELVLTSDRYRDQAKNTNDCFEKLRAMLLSVAVPPKRRKPTKPSKSSMRRRRADKAAQAEKKQHRRKPPDD